MLLCYIYNMNHLIFNDKKKRIRAAKGQLAHLVLGALSIEHFGISGLAARHLQVNFHSFYKFKLLVKVAQGHLKFSALVRVKNRCISTGRSKSVLRYYKVSRITFREFASFGVFPGLRKSSW